MNATEYIKVYHNNGRHLKVGSGTWDKAREEATKALAKHADPLPGDENVELEIYTHGQKTTVKSRNWSEILIKMGNADATPHIILVVGLVMWVAFAQLVMPFMMGMT